MEVSYFDFQSKAELANDSSIRIPGLRIQTSSLIKKREPYYCSISELPVIMLLSIEMLNLICIYSEDSAGMDDFRVGSFKHTSSPLRCLSLPESEHTDEGHLSRSL